MPITLGTCRLLSEEIPLRDASFIFARGKLLALEGYNDSLWYNSIAVNP
jgi:hypothetical protein